MSQVSSIVEAMSAITSSGSTISQQVSFINEFKDKIEEIASGTDTVKNTLAGEVGIQNSVKDYFDQFVAFLAQNEAPHGTQDAIVFKIEELMERTKSIDAVMVAAIEHVLESIRMFDAAIEVCQATTEAAGELAGQISESAG